jgi:hypothetical protein
MGDNARMHLAVSLLSGIADPSPGPEFGRLAGFVQKG